MAAITAVYAMAAPALNFRTLDLNLLRVFDVVMAERNLTRAGQRLALSQPAVSNALKRLKEAVGDELVTRVTTGVRPTPRAEALWPEVRSALGHLRAALAPAEFDPRTDAASFRLAMADATAATFLPPLVSGIEAGDARVDLRVVPLTTRNPSPLLEQGDADLAIGYFPDLLASLAAQGDDARLRHTRLHDSRYVCVMRRDHPLAGRPDLSLDDYCAAQHLLVSFSGKAHGLVDPALAVLGRKRRILLTVNQYFTAGQVVSASDLLAVLPAYFVPAAGCGDRIVTRPLPFHLDGLQVEMLWHLRHDRSSAHRWLRARLLAAAAERGAPSQ